MRFQLPSYRVPCVVASHSADRRQSSLPFRMVTQIDHKITFSDGNYVVTDGGNAMAVGHATRKSK